METLLSIVTLKSVLTLIIIAGAVYGFVSEKAPPDLTALLAILALLLTGVLTPVEAFSGFSHPATVSVAAVLVLSSAIERSGALSVIARRVLAPIGKSELLLTATLMLVIGPLSAFINNTAAVAIFIPVVLEVCRRTGASPGRVLMPMSHAATFGGMCTLIGTSTNLVAHEFARSQGLSGFSMFELGKVGLPMIAAGFAYILFVGRWFLPRNKQSEPETLGQTDPYLSELIVTPASPWIGREVNADNFQRDFDAELVGLMRDGQVVNPSEPGAHFTAGDSLRVRGPLDKVLALAAHEGLELHRPEGRGAGTDTSSPSPATTGKESGESRAPASVESTEEKTTAPGDEADEAPAKSAAPARLPLAAVVVLITSGLIGRTLKEARFAERYDAVALALKRRGGLRERPSTTRLHAGDVLVVEGTQESLKSLAETRGFLVIGTPAPPEQRPGMLLITLTTMIYGPGGYRFKDFVRMGIALDLLLAILALWLIPRFWPLAAQ
jgi:di/tricarboxylate transporter